MGEAWRNNIVEDFDEASELLRSAKRLAVLGIRSERHRGRPAFYVPEYLQSVGYKIIPIHVHHPEETEILGERVHRTVTGAPKPIDIVIVFRRSEDLASHLDDLLVARPSAVWLQSGIRDDDFSRTLAEAGIRVVPDRCAMIQHRLSR